MLRRCLRSAAVLLSAAIVGCGAGEGDEGSRGAATPDDAADRPAAAPAEPDTAGAPAPMPEEIYHDLTEFDWYRRGAPLLHDGTPYQPGGRPVPAETSALEPAGTYEGVRYWTRAGAARADTLFVPVYPRYWLPFVPAPGGGG